MEQGARLEVVSTGELHQHYNVNLMSHLGDPIHDCRLVLFSDSDFAGDARTSKSTTGLFPALVGPQTFAPIAVASKGQAAVSHSSTESEIIALGTPFELKDSQCSTSGARSCHCAPLVGRQAFVGPEATGTRKAGGDSQGSNSRKKDTNNVAHANKDEAHNLRGQRGDGSTCIEREGNTVATHIKIAPGQLVVVVRCNATRWKPKHHT